MSPALNGSLVIQHFKHSNAIEIRNGIAFDFYILQMEVILILQSYMPSSLMHP